MKKNNKKSLSSISLLCLHLNLVSFTVQRVLSFGLSAWWKTWTESREQSSLHGFNYEIHISGQLSFKLVLILWNIHKYLAILYWRSFIKPLANASIMIHEKLMLLGLIGRTEISLKGGLAICYYLSKADSWWTRSVWRFPFQDSGFRLFPHQHLAKWTGIFFFFTNFVYCCVSRLWKWIWEYMNKWKEFINHWVVDQCINTLTGLSTFQLHVYFTSWQITQPCPALWNDEMRRKVSASHLDKILH